MAYGIERAYGDPTACVSTVVSYLKDFSGGLREHGFPELGKKLTRSSRNVQDSLHPIVRLTIANMV
jgi:hypothetical protein